MHGSVLDKAGDTVVTKIAPSPAVRSCQDSAPVSELGWGGTGGGVRGIPHFWLETVHWLETVPSLGAGHSSDQDRPLSDLEVHIPIYLRSYYLPGLNPGPATCQAM